MPFANPALTSIINRRTLYKLKPTLPTGLTLKQIQDAVHEVVKHTPTAHNSQPNRAIILTGKSHHKIWDHVVKEMGENSLGVRRPTSVRDEAFGSVFFFIDEAITRKLQKEFPKHDFTFPLFDEQVTGAAQIQTWTVLQSMGLGAHLQHYNFFIDDSLPEDIPKSWKLKGQLVFGTPIAGPREKIFQDNPIKIYD
ncbi:hypothetical protein TBLA_0A05150 [Henningerozyma blattae CBS 6284]|uniref:Nitroreductase domain-containing protein n=1 Tax=Henningerozyma blattae (strain ATCC 34711 / CBS 6284 / DSM 70876 / NBRC 10599 / NRRL Y-10934 / UCD 77-7) TaxID=1071380 RepID=I2GW06_HENB6|nr:hypothetical protein TBLA_0A05150 [Tetrapisispora blattae CBS 6284]CCH58308.1 hypothetical protein TBLA_0A05150 [Tetrapisispora blattae CBS 6284]